ncbi:uncharacterized protein LOC143280173 [Babylonia areolata]|uniref:uncharacterized protein LOC143280173 n=1 Tax=Babylonia areolata TaxID=304850 RepID=UPI003FD254B4
MAEGGEGEMAASWWGGWIQSAKEKSMAALDMVRKDLSEFGTTMQSDAGHVVELTSSTLKDSLKTENASATKEKFTKGLNTFLERLSQALVVPPDDEGQIPITTSTAELYDRTKARIHTIQLDPGTYLQEPSGAQETYSMWCEGFELEDMKGEISELLVSKAEVRALYTKLVPSQVSHVDFWRRYFYKLHQLDVEQARKEALMKRADSVGAEDSISWDDDWSGDEAAAEDSGSDWEKLPRPGQHGRSPSPSLSPTPPHPGTVPTPITTSEQSADCQEVAPGERHAHTTAVEAGRRESVGQEEQLSVEQSVVTETSGPEQSGVSPAVTVVLTAPPSVEPHAPGSAPSPPTQSPAPCLPPQQQQHRGAGAFRDYLQLVAGGEKAESETETLSAAGPVLQGMEQSGGDDAGCGLSGDDQWPGLSDETAAPSPLTPSAQTVPEAEARIPDASLPTEAGAEAAPGVVVMCNPPLTLLPRRLV